MKCRRAQTSVEFLVLFGFMLMVFVFFFITIQQRLYEANKDSEYYGLRDVGFIVLNEIAMARSAENGYSREFSLPLEMKYGSYEVSIADDELLLESENNIFLEFLDDDVTGEIKKGDNFIVKDKNLIVIKPAEG